MGDEGRLLHCCNTLRRCSCLEFQTCRVHAIPFGRGILFESRVHHVMFDPALREIKRNEMEQSVAVMKIDEIWEEMQILCVDGNLNILLHILLESTYGHLSPVGFGPSSKT